MSLRLDPTIRAWRHARDYDGSAAWFSEYADVAERQGYRDEAEQLRRMARSARFRRFVEIATALATSLIIAAILLVSWGVVEK